MKSLYHTFRILNTKSAGIYDEESDDELDRPEIVDETEAPYLMGGLPGVAADVLTPFTGAHRAGKATALDNLIRASGHRSLGFLTRAPLTTGVVASLLGGGLGGVSGLALGSLIGGGGPHGAGIGAGIGSSLGMAGGVALAGLMRSAEIDAIKKRVKELYDAGAIDGEMIEEAAGKDIPNYGILRNVLLPFSGYHRAGWRQGSDFLRDGATATMSPARAGGLTAVDGSQLAATGIGLINPFAGAALRAASTPLVLGGGWAGNYAASR